MNLIIRRGHELDYAEILTLIKAFSIFQGTPEKVTITIEQMSEESALFQCFVAETDSGQIVGFASYFFAYYSWTGKALYLDDLYVKEEFRKQGIGKELLNTVIDLAKSENCKKIRWQVSKWNKNAIEFYKRMGATIDEVEINCDIMIDTGNGFHKSDLAVTSL